MLKTFAFAASLAAAQVAAVPGAHAADPAPAATPHTPTDLEKAQDALAANRFDDALALVDPIIAKALAGDAKSSSAVCPGDAVQFLQAIMAKSDPNLVVSVDNDWCRAMFIKGFVLNALNRNEEAADTLGVLVKHDKNRPNVWAEYAYALVQSQQLDAAQKAYQRAAALAGKMPAEADRHHWRAVALRGQGYIAFDRANWAEAEKLYRASLVEEPGNPIATSELAQIAQRRAQ